MSPSRSANEKKRAVAGPSKVMKSTTSLKAPTYIFPLEDGPPHDFHMHIVTSRAFKSLEELQALDFEKQDNMLCPGCHMPDRYTTISTSRGKGRKGRLVIHCELKVDGFRREYVVNRQKRLVIILGLCNAFLMVVLALMLNGLGPERAARACRMGWKIFLREVEISLHLGRRTLGFSPGY
ncbi:hypothetical protein EJ05DRAFT_505239 [Pseudovirgaria hyperparasitica]|uniref:Uncharacterized protein n=1 Tax=Pseudovirgaria hyperparasitica TaxID=470096 RepID=A0A6A6VVF9_9PEZI|nr:uncharacterized protein EJ05DRAFT_505239 [Pseudovirgaria hyperparasitica]KAF2753231.1 hypothetical protein EJ05DRAFT_505239 [Pseudovirgaria hyperparasitica]